MNLTADDSPEFSDKSSTLTEASRKADEDGLNPSRVPTGQRLQRDEEGQAVLLRLSDGLRSLSDPATIQKTAMQVLCEQLQLSRAFYFQVERDEDGWVHVIEQEFCRDPNQPSMIGRHSLKRFGSGLFESLAHGEPVVVEDVKAVPLFTADEVASYQSLGVTAFINVPLLIRGEYSAGITGHHTAPHAWTDDEIALMREVGHRTWEAVERARAETALRESEAKLRALVTASSYAVYSMSPDWREMRSLEGKGFLSDQLQPDEDWHQTYILPEDRPRVSAAIDEAIRTRSMFQLEHRVLQANGNVGWTLSRAIPLLDSEGDITEWIGTASDVTDRKLAEERLRESEEKYRTLFNSIDEGFCIMELICDQDGAFSDYRFLEVNSAFSKQTGLENATGNTILTLAPENEGFWVETYGEVVRTGTPQRFEHEARALGRWYDVFAFRVGQAEENKVAVVFADVSQKKLASAALQESEARFRLFVDNVREYALVQTDFEGIITSWNPGAERLFGYFSSEIVGKSFVMLLPEESRHDGLIAREMAKVTEGHKNVDAHVMQRKDDSQFWAEWITEPVFEDTGKLRGTAKVIRDETERQHADKAVRTSLAEKEELLKEVHHRVKNNLQVITSLLNLQAGTTQDTNALVLFEEARNRVQSIATIHELLYRSVSFASISLRTYATQLLPGLIEFYGMQKRVNAHILGDGESIELERAVPFGLLLNELVSNALKHAFPEERTGVITINIGQRNEDIVLRVSDDGVGLPAAFDPEQSSSLGLKLVKVLMRQLRGTLQVLPSNGATFEAQFPKRDRRKSES